MVHLNIFRPARKLLFMSKLVFRASKRILKLAPGASSLPIPDTNQMTPRTINVSHLIRENLFNAPQEGLIHDKEYYEPDSEGGFCIFRVEHTLFKVILTSVIVPFCSLSFLSRSIDVISCASHQHLVTCLAFPLSKEVTKEDRTTRQFPYLILSTSFVICFGYCMPCTFY